MTPDNKAIMRIKEQIGSIVRFSPTRSLEELVHDREDLHKRLEEGLNRMSESKVFMDNEIESVTKYAFETLDMRYNCIMNAVRSTVRGSWTF